MSVVEIGVITIKFRLFLAGPLFVVTNTVTVYP